MPSSSCSGSVRGEQACGSTDLMLPQAGMTLSGCICQEHAGTATCQCLVDSFRVAGGSTMLADAPCAEVDCTASSRSDKEREAGKRNVEEGNGIEMEEVAGAELPSASSWKKPLDQNVLSALKGDEIVRAQNWKAELAEKGKEVGMTDEEPSSSTSSASRGDENETTNLLSEVQTNVRYMFSATDVYTFVCITVWVSLCCAIVRRRMAMWIVGFSFIAFEVASLLLGLCDKQRSFTNSLTAAAEITVTYTVASERGQHHTQPALPQRRDLYHSTLIAYIHSLIASIGGKDLALSTPSLAL
ncbi:hypothetical protein CBR_g40087 [Chara braunii]|uniref:Uncharacterized protein n=1 Tax=Chara braunii TaxID=69332 RepID=A0A388LT54_CHABU|nr:hypothetical protein CBR_g40087 [Chara braunii]|eukprot:GBG85445.1 hypothetical protein CBR_g40087 [Chara braunii]